MGVFRKFPSNKLMREELGGAWPFCCVKGETRVKKKSESFRNWGFGWGVAWVVVGFSNPLNVAYQLLRAGEAKFAPWNGTGVHVNCRRADCPNVSPRPIFASKHFGGHVWHLIPGEAGMPRGVVGRIGRLW